MAVTDRPEELTQRSDRDPIAIVLRNFLSDPGEGELTDTEARFVINLAEGDNLSEAFRKALGPEVAKAMTEDAIRMGATSASRRKRVTNALAAETQRRILLYLPTALKVQHELAVGSSSDMVKERASRNIAAWCGLGAQAGEAPDRERTPVVPAARASVSINTDPK